MLTAIALILGFAAAPRTPNACEVLSTREVARVQGTRYTAAKLTEHDSQGLKMSQCFYMLPHFSDSVTVDLIRGDVTAFWKKHFATARDEDDEHENHPVANRTLEPDKKPLRIEGIGDAAVWSGNRVAGALYVLKGDTIVRVSVGGAGTQEQKIAKAKALAARALRRL
ncbi:MAG TPA: hypothetical protein VIW45_19850 [Vicinamibacterales bacterium]|jgi:hypothetical protein